VDGRVFSIAFLSAGKDSKQWQRPLIQKKALKKMLQ